VSDVETSVDSNEEIMILTSEIASAYFSNNQVQEDRIGGVIHSIAQALATLPSGGSGVPAPAGEPAVPIKKSVTRSAIICLECGEKQKMLKRHLTTSHGLTPVEYKEKWNLAKDYPLVAPDYAKQRSELAKKIGLGQSRKGNVKAKK
jgi:predicted transcriptional regulator